MAHLQEGLCFDEDQIYLSGGSNGGMFGYQLASRLPIFAGVYFHALYSCQLVCTPAYRTPASLYSSLIVSNFRLPRLFSAPPRSPKGFVSWYGAFLHGMSLPPPAVGVRPTTLMQMQGE
jgi:hypothetical protein